MRRTLYDRIRPAMHLCHLYGMGYCDGALRFAYLPLVIANLAATMLMFWDTASFIRAWMPNAYHTNLITSVARLNAKFLAPPFMIASMCWNRATVLDCLQALEDLVPLALREPLTPAAGRFVFWLMATLAAEIAQLLAFHVRTEFAVFFVWSFTQFVLSNIWPVTAVLIYTFLVDAVNCGVRDVNDSLVTMSTWRARRTTWQVLHRMVMHLTGTVFGPMIIAFVALTISDTVFLGYVTYVTFISNMIPETITYAAMMIIRIGLMTHLCQTCQRCKTEVSARLIPGIFTAVVAQNVFFLYLICLI